MNKTFHILIPVTVVLILNYIIFTKKWSYNKNIQNKNSLIPDGKIVAFVWIFLFMLLGNAHFILYKKNKMSFAYRFLLFVILYCISYPIVTKLDQKKAKIMNTVSLILSSILMTVVFMESREAFNYIVPLFIWTSFINYSDAIVCSNL